MTQRRTKRIIGASTPMIPLVSDLSRLTNMLRPEDIKHGNEYKVIFTPGNYWRTQLSDLLRKGGVDSDAISNVLAFGDAFATQAESISFALWSREMWLTNPKTDAAKAVGHKTF